MTVTLPDGGTRVYQVDSYTSAQDLVVRTHLFALIALLAACLACLFARPSSFSSNCLLPHSI